MRDVKVGDKVIATDSCEPYYFKGVVYTVLRTCNAPYVQQLLIDGPPEYDYGVFCSKWELYEEPEPDTRNILKLIEENGIAQNWFHEQEQLP